MVYSVILRKGEKYFTNLSMLFDAIENYQLDYNFLLNDVEAYPSNEYYLKLVDKDDVWVSGKELTDIIINDNFQWVWGLLYAFPKRYQKEEAIKSKNTNYDFIERVNVPAKTLNYDLAEFVIIPFDSSCVIIKSRNKEIIDLFKLNKPLAEDYKE